MAKAPKTKEKSGPKKTITKKVVSKKTKMENRGLQTKAGPTAKIRVPVSEPQKNAFEEKFGEGTAFDLDYGKLLIIALCIYIAVQVS